MKLSANEWISSITWINTKIYKKSNKGSFHELRNITIQLFYKIIIYKYRCKYFTLLYLLNDFIKLEKMTKLTLKITWKKYEQTWNRYRSETRSHERRSRGRSEVFFLGKLYVKLQKERGRNRVRLQFVSLDIVFLEMPAQARKLRNIWCVVRL